MNDFEIKTAFDDGDAIGGEAPDADGDMMIMVVESRTKVRESAFAAVWLNNEERQRLIQWLLRYTTWPEATEAEVKPFHVDFPALERFAACGMLAQQGADRVIADQNASSGVPRFDNCHPEPHLITVPEHVRRMNADQCVAMGHAPDSCREAAHNPPSALYELEGTRWFQCRHCHGIFVVGLSATTPVKVEADAARAHEAECAERKSPSDATLRRGVDHTGHSHPATDEAVATCEFNATHNADSVVDPETTNQ